MGLNLNELSSLAGGVAEGIDTVQQQRIRANQETRMQEAWGRTTEGWKKEDIFRDAYGKWNAELTGAADAQGGPPPGAGPGIMPQQGQAIPAPGQASPPPGTTSPAAPAGGQALPAGGSGTPSGEMGPPATLAGPGGGIGQPGGMGTPKPSKREKLRGLEQEILNAAMQSGGLEAYKSAKESLDFTRRGQMIAFANQASQAMHDSKNAGAAAKHLNAVMEMLPVDSGVEWVAKNGNLHVSRNGKLSEPIDGDGVWAYARQYLMDDSNYEKFRSKDVEEEQKWDQLAQGWDQNAIAWAQLAELGRSNQADETLKRMQHSLDTAIRTRLAGVQEDLANVQEGYLGVAQDKAPAEIALMGSQIFRNLLEGEASMERARAGAMAGLKASDYRAIMNDIVTNMQTAKVDPGMEWVGAIMDSPGVGMSMQSDAIDTMFYNPMGSVNYADTIALAAIAHAADAGVELSENTPMPTHLDVAPDGRYYAVFNGKPIFISKRQYDKLDAMNEYSESSGALPGSEPSP